MELAIREKEVLNVFGCMNYEATMKRLGLACALIVNPQTKAVTWSLRNKLADTNLGMHRICYIHIITEFNCKGLKIA